MARFPSNGIDRDYAMKNEHAKSAIVVDDTTVSEEGEDDSAHAYVPPSLLGLVLVWSKDEPWRIGQTLLLPADAGATVWIGRGANSAGKPLKGTFGEQRPGQWVPSAAIRSQAISRHQVSLSFHEASGTHIAHNLGKCSLFHNGKPANECPIVAGDLLQLGKQLLFLCCRRPLQIPGEPGAFADFPFGQPDAHGIVGESPAAWRLRQQLAFVAARSDHVIITGRSGSGKELVAGAIHALSARGGRPIVARNAATLPEALIDAELFGNARSYPNPGMAERSGLIGEAHGSTLFLDEIAELPQAAQAHLLRVLDGGEYQRLGEARARTSDFRLVAATNRELSSLKPDLLARLALRVRVPDLDERKEDVPLLVRHLLRQKAEQGDSVALELFPDRDPRGEPQIPLSFMLRFLERGYTMNVRELKSLLWEALSRPSSFAAEPSSDEPRVESRDSKPPQSALGVRVMAPDGALSAERVQQALDENNGSIERSWRALQLSSRFALVRLIKKYGLEVRKRPMRKSRA